MSKSSITIIVLIITLIASNGLWAYALSFGKNPSQNLHMKCEPSAATDEVYREAVIPLEAAIAASASPLANRDNIVRAVTHSDRGDVSACQWDEGMTVVQARGLTLKFDQRGKLIAAMAGICVP